MGLWKSRGQDDARVLPSRETGKAVWGRKRTVRIFMRCPVVVFHDAGLGHVGGIADYGPAFGAWRERARVAILSQ